MAPTARIDPGLQRLASAFSPDWLAVQRWFRAKSRRLTTVELVDAAAIAATTGWLLVLEATDEAGERARYLVPAVLDGDGFREPRDGEGIWQRLVDLMAADGGLRASRGGFSFTATPALAALLPKATRAVGLAERRLGVEQSNTSVALGDRLILKCYRLLTPGVNPEVEINAFLTAVGFVGAPRLGGSAEYQPDDGEASAAAMLQELVASEADGWAWVQARLAGGAGDREKATDALGQIGALTQALHRALASRPEMAAFPARTATTRELAAWHARADGQLETALASLSGEPRQRLLAVAPRIRRRLDALRTAHGARASRIHGDYHLGQLLRTATGFSVIDFEGEPARPLAERRAPASPLRDVAGMLRSIDYVARVAHREAALAEPNAWVGMARAAFLSAYGGVSATEARLLDAFEIEKACYEVAYEANNRPDWAWVPLDALERLAGQAR
ncbi:MAG: hypothetical protein HYX54_09690 [Chloroflexi bacterium]|nr:hypothetical protein [Chloroflexota bacterium]